ncbi:MAG: hypothetical protein HYT87_04135 [Nitrospirae bacterium]|nr:hypothetical protein [Nitrospirota bacterium]
MNIRSMRILLLFALTMVVVAACDTGKTLEGTTTQLGSLQGRVTEGTPETAAAAATTAAPSRQAQAQLPDVKIGEGLPGVRVTVFLKGQLKTTKTSIDNPKTKDVDEGGYFTIADLPAGVLLPVTFDRDAYVKLNGNVEIPAVAGSGQSAIPLKDPVATIEVAMVKGTGSASLNLDRLIKFKGILQGIVVDGTPGADRGKALGDVTISLFVGGNLITTKSKANDEKTSFDETGYFSVSNLPPGQPISATFELKDYQKTRITVTIPVTEGTEDPAANVEVKLVKGDITKIIEETIKPLPYNGTIQGIVRDGTVAADTFGKPLSGVTVAALVLGKVVETTSKEDDPLTPGFDETGFFALNNLPINIAIPVRFKADGYVPVTSVITIPDPTLSTADVEQETSQVTYDVDLVKDTASLLVVVYAGKGVANGATVVLDLTGSTLSNSTGTSLTSGFDIRQVKTTDDKGQVTFDKLPPIVISGSAIVVQPFDEDKGTDKNPDYKTTTAATVGIASVDLRQLTTGTGPSVVRINLLTSASITPTVLWSNVVSNAVLNKDDILKFIFDLPMDTMPVAEVKDTATGKVTTVADPRNGTFAVTLTDPAGQAVPFKSTWTNNVTLEVDPFSDLQPSNAANFVPTATCPTPPTANTDCYTVTVQARSIQGMFMAAEYSRRFKVTEKAAALTAPTPATWPNPLPGTGAFNWNTAPAGIILQWGQDANATGYNVYAKDNGLNKDWVRISSGLTFPATAGTTHSPTIVYALTALPTQFDRCNDLNDCPASTVEPLAFGGQLTLAVTALNRDGIESALDDTKIVTIADNTPPTITGLTLSNANQTALANQTAVSGIGGTAAQQRSANNSANCPTTATSCTNAKTIRVRLTGFGEPMGSGGTASIIDAATAPCNAAATNSNNANVTIVAGPTWSEATAAANRPGLRELYVDVSVPANTSGVGECIKFNLSGVADVAGNGELALTPASDPNAGIDGAAAANSGEIYIYKLD